MGKLKSLNLMDLNSHKNLKTYVNSFSITNGKSILNKFGKKLVIEYSPKG